MKTQTPRLFSRREATTTLLAFLGGAALVACATEVSGDDGDGAGTGDGGTGTGTGTGTGEGGVAESGTADAWASGGTAAMTDEAAYPDPFATPATSCLVMTAATLGPCTEAEDQVRQDVSEGYAGLPMRLALRVVGTDCEPISGAKVKIWHTQRTGSYSGNTPNNGMCLKDQADSTKHYFRGVQTTDADGRVAFDSCFPGWYRGRTVHIHFTVTVGSSSFTSQLVFDDALVAELFASHPDYAEFGQPDTTNVSDNIVGRVDRAPHTLATARMSDGAMLASKQITVAA